MRASLATMASVCLLAPALLSGAARADGDSIFTIGVGTGVGVRQTASTGEPSATAFVNQANLRIKFLEVFGLDYSFDLQHDPSLVTVSDDALQYAAKMRLSALVYPYNGETVGFYLGAGIGGASTSDLTRFDAASNSYTAGVGFELHLASHLSIDASFMLVIPGASSIKNVAVARVKSALESKDVDEITNLSTAGLGDFVSLDNHEIMIRILLFL